MIERSRTSSTASAKRGRGAAVLLAAAAALTLTLATPDTRAQLGDEEQIYQGVVYACTGIGNSKWDPRWDDYPVKIVFAAGNGLYLADNHAVIQQRDGTRVFEAHCYAPWLMVGLSPGRYTVTGSTQGVSHAVDFVVHPNQQTYVAVRFPEIIEY